MSLNQIHRRADRAPRQFTALRLDESRLDEFLALQDLVHQKLQRAGGARRHILTRLPREKLEQHLAAGRSIIALADERDRIVAQCLLSDPFDGEAPVPGRTVLIQAFMVDPGVLKDDALTRLYDAAMSAAAQDGFSCVVTRTAIDNVRIIESLKRVGFTVYGTGKGPVYGNDVTLLKYDLPGPAATAVSRPGSAPSA